MAQARYHIRLYDQYAQLLAVITQWRTLNLKLNLNDVSSHQLSISGIAPVQGVSGVSYLKELFYTDGIVEVWRKVSGGSWYLLYGGFHRTPHNQIGASGVRIYTSYGRSYLDLIKRRKILYKGTTAYTLKGKAGETVIKEFVNENAGPGANNSLRVRNGWFHYTDTAGVIHGLYVGVDSGQGVVWKGAREWKNLLEVIQEVGKATSIDFDITRNGTNYSFETYYPQKGTDRRATLVFDPLLGNMTNPSYAKSRTEEATIVAVLGQGEGTSRRIVVRESSAKTDSPWNDIEETQDSRNEDTYLGMVSTGDEALREMAAQENFTFEVLQTASAQFGVDYDIGDLVTAQFDNINTTKKITGADITVSDGQEKINLEFGNIDSDLVITDG